MAPSNPLGPDGLLQAIAAALPERTTSAASSAADIVTPYEALALFVHACMARLGFRLVGFEEDRIETFPQAPRLPAHWHATPTSLSFVYTHPQSALTFVIRTDRMGSKAEIRGLATGAERIQRIELVVQDYVATGALPWTRPAETPGDADTENAHASGAEDSTAQPTASTATTEQLGRLFFSRERISQLAARFQADIVQKLIPGLHKEGYEETADDRAVREDADRTGRQGGRPGASPATDPGRDQPQPPINPYQPDSLLDPLAAPRRPIAPPGDFPPPGFEDEYEVLHPPRGLRVGGNGGLPLGGIGHDDLHPPGLGPRDPLRPSLGGVGGLGGGLGGFGGMHPTFDDPLFVGPGGRQGGGGARGDGFDGQIPPGARYDDPTGGIGGPGPRFGGGRRPGGGGFGNGGGFNPYGGGFGGGFGGDII